MFEIEITVTMAVLYQAVVPPRIHVSNSISTVMFLARGGRGFSPNTELAGTLTLDLPASGTVRDASLWFISHAVCGIFFFFFRESGQCGVMYPGEEETWG